MVWRRGLPEADLPAGAGNHELLPRKKERRRPDPRARRGLGVYRLGADGQDRRALRRTDPFGGCAGGIRRDRRRRRHAGEGAESVPCRRKSRTGTDPGEILRQRTRRLRRQLRVGQAQRDATEQHSGLSVSALHGRTEEEHLRARRLQRRRHPDHNAVLQILRKPGPLHGGQRQPARGEHPRLLRIHAGSRGDDALRAV